MKSPFPNINIVFETSQFEIDTTNPQTEGIDTYSGIKEITNYEYEIQKNNQKRKILALKKEYLGVFIDDLRNIMKYDESSQFIDERTKRV